MAEEIAGPLGADFQIGAAETDSVGSRRSSRRRPLPFDLAALDPDSPVSRRSPAGGRRGRSEHAGWRHADMGATNGHGNARSVARILKALALGGSVDGVRLLSPATIDAHLRGAEPRAGPGARGPAALRHRLCAARDRDRAVRAPGPACYWGGWGGSIIIMDLDSRTTISYMMNRMAPGIIGSDRSEVYVRGD